VQTSRALEYAVARFVQIHGLESDVSQDREYGIVVSPPTSGYV